MDRSQKRKMKNMVKDLNYVNYENLYIPAKLMAIISSYKNTVLVIRNQKLQFFKTMNMQSISILDRYNLINMI